MTVAAKPKPDPARDRSLELASLPLDQIEAAPNVRDLVGDVEELAASIRIHGVLQPIRVRQLGDRRYALVFGQRRLAAARLAGLERIPAVVDDRSETPAIEQLVENLQRADLNPLEEANAYRELLNAGLTQRELATKLGRSQPSIADKLRLLKLPDPVRERITSGELSASHAKAIAALPAGELTEMARRIVDHKLSAHQVESEVRLALDRASAQDRRRDEARGLADAAEAALAKKKGASKELAQLRVYDQDVSAELKRRGWKTEAKVAAYYGKPKSCTCIAWSISRNYMGAGASSKVTLEATCVEPKHVATDEKVRIAEAEKRNAEYKERQKAEFEARGKALERAVAIVTSDQGLRARLALHELVAEGYGTDADAFWAAVVPDVDHPRGISTWDVIGKLETDVVDHWLTRLLAGASVDADIELEIPEA